VVVTWEIQDSVLVLTTAGFGGHETLFALSQAVSDPAFRPGLALLCDLRLEIDDLSWEEMRSRAKFVASLIPVGISPRCALVIGVHQYGIARMEAAHLEFEGMQPEVFRDIDDAREWLAAAAIPAVVAARKPQTSGEKRILSGWRRAETRFPPTGTE
jgi:hypothetical protein